MSIIEIRHNTNSRNIHNTLYKLYINYSLIGHLLQGHFLPVGANGHGGFPRIDRSCCGSQPKRAAPCCSSTTTQLEAPEIFSTVTGSAFEGFRYSVLKNIDEYIYIYI